MLGSDPVILTVRVTALWVGYLRLVEFSIRLEAFQ